MNHDTGPADFFEPLPTVEPVAAALRKRVIVVGAGVVGLSSALWLQRAGHEVGICDPNPPLPGVDYSAACSFGNASTMAYGACIPMASPGIAWDVPRMLLSRSGPLSIFWRDLPSLTPWLLSFLRASRPREFERIVTVLGQLIRLAEAGHAPLIAEAKLEHLLRRTGCLYLYSSEEKFRAAQRDIDLRRRQGVRMEILDAPAIRAREPALAPRYAKGFVFLDAYSIDTPQQYMAGLAALFQQRGGAFIQHKAQGIVRQDGVLSVNAGGALHSADSVVVAAGAWSTRVVQGLGSKVRLDTERGYHVLFPDSGSLLSAPTCYPEFGFYMTPLSEGLRAAGTVELGGLGQPLRPVRTDIIEKTARTLLPDLGPAGRRWLGFRPSTPDSLPVIGYAPGDKRIVYAFGHGHIGLTLGGITGRIVSDLVSARTPPVDISALRPERFD